MPIHLEMIENGHILWFHIEGAWKPAEIPVAKEKTRQFFQQAHHPVHALVDLRHASVNLPLLTASQQVIGGDPLPNAGQIAIVGVPRLLRMMAEPILRVAAHDDPITFFDTIEQGKAYLRRFISHDK
ncbi:MAG: hypothetical protein IT324_10085 [Anaerolineae bacterium]|nr:hypothetical protein [Anaerolineae bacterium]